MSECNHGYDQTIWIGKDDRVYGQCSNCNTVFCLTVDFDTNKFRTTMKPTNHDRKIFNITKLDDGTYLYERKEVENKL